MYLFGSINFAEIGYLEMNYFSAENLSKSFGEQVLFEGLTFGLARGDKTALIARNGTGKTTLLRIMMGRMASDSGEFTFRSGIKTAFLEQVPELDGSLTIDQLILTDNTPVLAVIKHYEKALDKHSQYQTPDTGKILMPFKRPGTCSSIKVFPYK